jgi:hypothetical protein
VSQAGRNRHEDICASLSLFASEVMPEFHEGEEAREKAKAERLGESVEAALARRSGPVPAPEGYHFPALPGTSPVAPPGVVGDGGRWSARP